MRWSQTDKRVIQQLISTQLWYCWAPSVCKARHWAFQRMQMMKGSYWTYAEHPFCSRDGCKYSLHIFSFNATINTMQLSLILFIGKATDIQNSWKSFLPNCWKYDRTYVSQAPEGMLTYFLSSKRSLWGYLSFVIYFGDDKTSMFKWSGYTKIFTFMIKLVPSEDLKSQSFAFNVVFLMIR